MTPFTQTLETEFERNKNLKVAAGQRSYMRNQFEYYGLIAKARRDIQKPFLSKGYLPDKKELEKIVETLWQKEQREYQLFGQELVFKYAKHFEKKDFVLFEFMITRKSWWDTVDFIATKLLGHYFKMYPEQREPLVDKWLKSGNIWLQRSAALFQLKYQDDLDTNLLSATIHSLLGSKEFFVNKAIGWILREYSKTNPAWVAGFVQNTALAPLSKREALKLMEG
jgi:3-methyladenine DNA glycosylase AlkD